MFKNKYRYYTGLIENYLKNLPWDDKDILSKSMSYTLMAGGKRIRPVLSLASAEIVGSNPETIIPCACGLEMIHTYSLVHDDLPCMDNDDYRRGRLTNHKVFGEATALLAGDGLLTYGFELLAADTEIPVDRQIRVIRETAQAAGWQGMVRGQILDTFGEKEKLNADQISKIHNLKTGALITASARLGAILGGGTEADIQQLTLYSAAVGLAFQIKDDILDIEGNEDVIGKPVGSDIKLQKSTYPSIMGMDGAKIHLKEKITEAKEALHQYGNKAEFLICLADYIETRDS